MIIVHKRLDTHRGGATGSLGVTPLSRGENHNFPWADFKISAAHSADNV